MNFVTFKMFLRSIRGSLGRFLAILAIVALGVGFFSGIKSSQPAMLRTLDRYYRAQNMYDFQLLSSLGFTKEDVDAFWKISDVDAAEGACFADAYAVYEGAEEDVFHFQTLTEEVAVPVLTAGRMPLHLDECLADDLTFSESDLGKTIYLASSNSDDTLDRFSVRYFVIVGLARSPRYINADRGTSDLGSGKPAGFLFIPPEAFADEVYHEILLSFALPEHVYSSAYQDQIHRLKPIVEALLNQRGVLRYQELRRKEGQELEDAKKKLQDAWIEYRIGLRKSERELENAYNQLIDAEEQLQKGRETLSTSVNAMEQGERLAQKELENLEAQKKDLQQEQEELSNKKTALEQELEELRLQKLNKAADREAALREYTTRVATLSAELLALQGTRNMLGTDPSDVFGAISGLFGSIFGAVPSVPEDSPLGQLGGLFGGIADNIPDQIEDLDKQIAETETELAEARAALQQAEEAYDKAADQTGREQRIEEIRSELLELNTEEITLQQKEAELLASEAALQATMEMLPAVRQEVEAAQAEFAKGEKQLADGWAQYNAGKEKSDRELGEACQKLEDGEKELADGEKELEKALQLDLYCLDRSSNYGYVTFENDSAIVDGIAVAFPIFFALVAALVCVTTMTRMVNEERTQIGTMKSLGYSSPAIMLKYLGYAGLSSLIGCIGGFFLGCTGLPYIVWFAYNILYRYADLLFLYDPFMFLGCLVVSVVGCCFVTWLTCRRALTENPAALIRPKAPVLGKRVLLEHIPVLWNHISFLGKVSLRNAFRYPLRVLMMILGIGGCTALMVAGFGVRDSISNVAEYQYEEIALYDITVSIDTEKAPDRLSQTWENWTEASTLANKSTVQAKNGDQSMDTDLILFSSEGPGPVLNLHEKDRTPISWVQAGNAILSRKVSEVLSLQAGDRIVVCTDSGKETSLLVTGVCDYFIGHAIFASKDSFPEASDNCAFLKAKDGEDIGLRAAELRRQDGVSYVSLSQTERETMESSMASLDLLVLMLVFCSGALAFITLYNLTNINIMERIREVATVQVLGFTPGETAAYILNENLLLSFLGALFGLFLGKLLHRFVLDMVQVDAMMFDIRITLLSYFLSFLITLVFAALTCLFMRRKLTQINMAESLKSVE